MIKLFRKLLRKENFISSHAAIKRYNFMNVIKILSKGEQKSESLFLGERFALLSKKGSGSLFSRGSDCPTLIELAAANIKL